MTKFQVMSDLHQEFYERPILSKKDIKGDVLLLAGDITNGMNRIAYMDNFLIPIYYVPGNHDYYGYGFDQQREIYETWIDTLKMNSFHYMNRDTAIVEGVRIVAATLWTNFMAPFPGLIGSGDDVRWEDQRDYCERLMRDYDAIKGFKTQQALEEHKKDLDYIKLILSQKHDGPTIVMTHHAPSFRSSHHKYDSSAIKGGFCSALDYVIEEFQPDYWIHGHCHETFNYHIGKTNVICNPRGYFTENFQGFRYDLVLEL